MECLPSRCQALWVLATSTQLEVLSQSSSRPSECHLLMQAMFEILTSEFSYLHSLKILVTQFLQTQELKATMTQTEHHHLFSNILDVLDASQK